MLRTCAILVLLTCVIAVQSAEPVKVLMPLANGFNNTEFVLGYYPMVAHGYRRYCSCHRRDDLRSQGWSARQAWS